MANKRRHVTFSTDFPKSDDFDFRNGVFEDQVLRRAQDVFCSKGVVKGYLNELEVYTDTPEDPTHVHVRTGAAWILGERAPVTAVAEVTLTGVEIAPRLIRITHAEVQNGSANSHRPHAGGPDEVVWYDDAAVLVDKDAEAPLEEDEQALAAVGWVEGALVITDYRTWVKVVAPLETGLVDTDALGSKVVTGPKVADAAIDALQVKDAAITTAKLHADSVTTPKVIDGAIVEAKMAMGTDIVMLHSSFVDHDDGAIPDPTVPPLGTRYIVDGSVVENRLAGVFVVPSLGGPIRSVRATYQYHLDAGDPGDHLKLALVVWPYGYDGEAQQQVGEPHGQDTEGEETLSVPINPLFARTGRYVWVLKVERLDATPATHGWFEDVCIYGVR